MEVTIQRKIPFSVSEKELLTQLVARHKIIEDKSTNTRNIQLKKDAWKAVAQAYNSSSLTQKRTDLQLKRCWENMKSLRRKVLSSHAKEVSKTGGGPPPPEPPSSLIDALCPLLDYTVPGIVDSNYDEDETDVMLFNEGESSSSNNITDVSLDPSETLHEIRRNVASTNEDVTLDTTLPSNTPHEDERNVASTNEGATLRKLRGINREGVIRVERLKILIKQESELHEVRIIREKTIAEREKILLEREKCALEREKNALSHEKVMQEFQRQREMLLKEKLLQNMHTD